MSQQDSEKLVRFYLLIPMEDSQARETKTAFDALSRGDADWTNINIGGATVEALFGDVEAVDVDFFNPSEARLIGKLADAAIQGVNNLVGYRPYAGLIVTKTRSGIDFAAPLNYDISTMAHTVCALLDHHQLPPVALSWAEETVSGNKVLRVDDKGIVFCAATRGPEYHTLSSWAEKHNIGAKPEKTGSKRRNRPSM